MRINHNIAALNTYRQLSNNGVNTQKSLEKLSSGLRINKAGDDAAGLAISEKMRGQIRGLDQAARNAQDGISMIQSSEGALAETQSILQRMKELATQASNGTNTDSDRAEIQKEINQLSSEVNRIGNTTEFNTQNLLKGSTAPVVETAAAQTTVKAGVAGVAAGDISDLSVDTASVKKVNSQATVQASRAEATGSTSTMRTNTLSVKGAVSSVTLSNGVVFESKTTGTGLNDRKIVIEQSATAGSTSSVTYSSTGDGTYTFTIGMTDGGVSRVSNRGELYNELNTALQAGSLTDTEVAKLTLKEPTDTSIAVTSVATSGVMANGRGETNGVYEFDLTDKFEEAGDTISIEGQTFKTVLNNADASAGEFAVGSKTQVTGGLAVKATAVNFTASNVTGTVNINVAGRDFTISQAALNAINDAGGSLTTRIDAINDAVDGNGIMLSTVADVAEDGNTGKIQIVAKESQSEAITWTANGDLENRQRINEAFGMNTIAKITGVKGVESTADLDGIKAAWDTGDINVSTIASGESASYTFSGVTVVVHATDAAGLGAAAGTAGNALNFTDTSLKSGDAFAKMQVLSNSTVHMYWDVAAGGNDTADSASFADNLAAAFNAAKYYDGTDFNGPATGGLENFTITNQKGTYDTADALNAGRVVFTADEALGATKNAEKIITTAAANKGAIANTTTASQQQAVWDSGDMTGIANGETKTLTFGGVTVNITGVAAAANLVGGTVSASTNSKYDVVGNTINLTMDTSVISTNGGFAVEIGAILEAEKGNVASAAEMNEFTFAGANGTSGTNATGHITITRDAVTPVPIQSTYEIGGTISITYLGGDTQLSNGAGRLGMMGTDSITDDTAASFTVDGREFTISNADLKAFFNESGGANTPADVLNLVSTRALDEDGNALSTVASVSLGTNNKLEIISLTEGSSSSVIFGVSGGDANSIGQVERALGVTNATSDTGESPAFENLTATSQADSLATAINANDTLGTRFNATVNGTKITLTERTDQATGTSVSSPVVAGAGSDDKLVLTNTGGQNLKTLTITQSVQQTIAVAAKTDKIDTSFQATAATAGTELNGLKISFSGLTNDATGNAITATFDAETFTVNVTGNIQDDPLNAASDIATDMETAINDALTAEGFTETGGKIVTIAAGGTAGDGAGILAAFNGNYLEFGKANDANSVMGQVAIASNDTMAVSQTNGNLTIHLANTSAYKNTAENIQRLVQALGTNGYTSGIDFSKYEFSTKGDWDTATTGNSIKKDTSALIGGTEETKGVYSFEITKELAAGDIVEVAGKAFKAVSSNPSIANNEFQVVDGDTLADQAVRLADTVGAAFSTEYTATTLGSKVVLTENTADGVNMISSDLSIRATGTSGEYSVAAPELLTSGAKFVVDGEEIAVSSKNENVGYANGTAIKAASSVADQAKALAEAINTNANLKSKYTASAGADGSLTLKQNELFATETAPVVSTKSSAEGNFKSTFQVGANSGQSMTIEVADMRSAALGITGDGSATTVKASNGYTASYVSTANVTDGTTSANVEFALDISTYEKATAAVGVLEDAITAVSAQRSQLGAYQNRLEHTINNLGTSSENLTAAESRIRDVDMAKEMTEFTKNNILQQAAQAMLAQANQQPQGVLQLLR